MKYASVYGQAVVRADDFTIREFDYAVGFKRAAMTKPASDRAMTSSKITGMEKLAEKPNQFHSASGPTTEAKIPKTATKPTRRL